MPALCRPWIQHLRFHHDLPCRTTTAHPRDTQAIHDPGQAGGRATKGIASSTDSLSVHAPQPDRLVFRASQPADHALRLLSTLLPKTRAAARKAALSACAR